MTIINKTDKKLLAIFIILGIFRLINLHNFPIFGDEALYLYLSDKILTNPNSLIDSINFGVMPIFIWILSILLFINNQIINPLILGRVSTVLLDIMSAYLVYSITKLLFNKFTGIVSSIIYLLIPLNFLHSRLVLLESPVNFFSLASIYFVLIVIFKKSVSFTKYKLLVLSALFFVISYFIKPISLIIFPTLVGAFIISVFNYKKINIKSLKDPFLQSSFLSLLIIILIATFYLPISDYFNKRFLIENSTDYFTEFKKNLWLFYWWSKNYFTFPIIFIVIGGIFYGICQKDIKILWLFFWVILATFISTFKAANFYPRHLYLLTAPLSIIVAVLIAKIFSINKFMAVFIILSVLILPLKIDLNLLINPQSAPIALEDKQQYFDDWTSGTGLDKVSFTLNQLSREQKITVFVDDESSQSFVLKKIYKVKNSEIFSSNNLYSGKYLEKELQQKINSNSYMVLNKNPEAPPNWPVIKIASFPKSPNRSINIYRIIPSQ